MFLRSLNKIRNLQVHNIPEGLSVGVGFGSIGKTKMATFEKAFNLALGIGLVRRFLLSKTYFSCFSKTSQKA